MASRTAAGGGVRAVQDASIGGVLTGFSAVTVVVWVKSDLTTTDRGFLYTVDTTPNGSDAGLGCRYDVAGATWGGPNKIKLSVQHTGAVQQLETSDNTQTTNLQSIIYSWTSGAVIQCWLDGVLDPLTTGGTSGGSAGTTNNNTAVCMNQGGKDTNNAWDGVVYEIRIYDRKLAANEVVSIDTLRGTDGIKDGLIFHWLPNAGAPGTSITTVKDRSDNGNDGTATGTVTYEEDEIVFRKRRAA